MNSSRSLHPLALAALLTLLGTGLSQAAFLGLDASRTLPMNPFTPYAISAQDLDGDGDLDLLAASHEEGGVFWYENTTGTGEFCARHPIDAAFLAGYAVEGCDLDGDGDIDALVTSEATDRVVWYENLGGGIFGPQRVLDSLSNGPRALCCVDLDQDLDPDVLVVAYEGDQVLWLENVNGDATLFARHLLSTGLDAPHDVDAADLDGDGDPDIAVASHHDNRVTWYENGGLALSFTEHLVSTATAGAVSIGCGDITGDGACDLFCASYNDASVRWFENDGQAQPSFVAHTLTGSLPQAIAVAGADLDADLDLDLVAVSRADGTLKWYENDNGDGSHWTARSLSAFANGANSLSCGDLDGDGITDVAFAAGDEGLLAWRKALPYWTPWIGEARVIAHVPWRFSRSATGDLDGDGRPDLLVYENASDHVNWYRNRGDSVGWDDPLRIAVDLTIRSLAVVDIDGDEDLDVALTLNGADEPLVWVENLDGLGTFSCAPVVIPFPWPDGQGLAACDPDGDGDQDLLCVTLPPGPEYDTVWMENLDGAGGAWLSHILDAASPSPRISMELDADGDGDADLISICRAENRCIWFENLDGQGTFGPETQLFGAGNPTYMVRADVDENGRDDLLVLTAAGSSVTLFRADSSSVWTGSVLAAGTLQLAYPVCVDADQDGDLDLLAVDGLTDHAVCLENPGDGGLPWVVQDLGGDFSSTDILQGLDANGDDLPDLVGGSTFPGRLFWYAQRTMAEPITLSISLEGTAVRLQWEGGAHASWRVYASDQSSGIVDPLNLLTTVGSPSLLLPSEALLETRFYQVVGE